ncbi:MAG: hypothetical protein ACLQDY_17345 [Streptosporangiaceae bacterium]
MTSGPGRYRPPHARRAARIAVLLAITATGAASAVSASAAVTTETAAAVTAGRTTAAPAAAPAGLSALADSGLMSAPLHFRTLRPGAKLPSGAQCTRWVHASPRGGEVRPGNRRYNHTTGQRLPASFLSGDTAAARKLVRRVNGYFTGTTRQILRWAACKWGINQNIVFAQAAVESWWRQTTLGDWGTVASACPPGHKPGADGKPGQCPQSYGILQNRYPYERGSWPGIGRSTAMNADTAYMIWRSCYDGYETWLNTVPRGSQYHSGDAWGCVGRWYAGRWHTAAANGYIRRVQQYLRERIWTTADFRNAG